MPKLWRDTIEAHRREVHDAILDTTATLVAERGLLSVTMSEIAARAGIGRATLYKYFPDVEAILTAWHEREVAGHLAQLAGIRDRADRADARLEAVLENYALIAQEHHGTELAALLHRGGHVTRAENHLREFIRDLIAEGTEAGHIRHDVPAAELATYCMNAVTAASTLPSQAAVRRLVGVILTGLRPSGRSTGRRSSGTRSGPG